jgi:TonB-dependent receptor
MNLHPTPANSIVPRRRIPRALGAAFVSWPLLAASLLTVPAALTSVALAQAGSGTVEGRVQSATSGNYLNNARVRVVGTNLETFTNAFGEYRLAGLPAGTATLEVFYTGLATRRVEVTVPAAGSVQRDLELRDLGSKEGDTVVMSAFLVASQRETDAAAIAIHEQRFAPNKKDVIATDAFGDINQGNIGEFVKFIPGISLDVKDGNNPSGIMVRGFDPNYTIVTMDGGQLASTVIANTQTSSRQFVLEQANINNLSRIEVTKLPTPDMSANLLGGAVNFVSRSAFERPRQELRFQVFLSANSKAVEFRRTAGPLQESTFKALPSFDITFAKPVNKRFGFVANAAHYSQYYLNNQSVIGHRFTSAGATVANPYVTNVNTTYNPNRIDRDSVSLKLDWKPFPHHVLAISTQANAFKQQNSSRVISYNIGGGTPVRWNEHDVVGSQVAAGTNVVSLGGNFQSRHGLTRALGAAWTWNQASWLGELAGSYSNSNNRVRDTAKGLFNSISSSFPIGRAVTLEGVDASTAAMARATVYDVSGAPVNELQLSNYNLTQVNSQPMNAADTVKEVRASLTKKFTLAGNPLAVKLGGTVNDVTRNIRYTTLTWNFVGTDGLQNSPGGDDSFGRFPDAASAGQSPGYGRPGPQWPSPWAVFSAFRSNPAWFLQTPTQEGDTVRNTAIRSPWLHETISAGYAMADTKLFRNRLRLVGGVRYELTETEGRGFKQDNSAVFQRDANGRLRIVNGAYVRKPEAGAAGSGPDQSLIYTYRGQYGSRDYGYYFPSAHATFNLTDSILLRAATAKTMGRPNMSDVVPTLTVSDNVSFDPSISGSVPGTISGANSSLKPWRALNYDYALEWYLPRNGLLSYNWFKKDIRDFFSTLTTTADAALLTSLGLSQDYVGYRYSTRINIADAMIKGWEINAQLPLSNLTAWSPLSGFDSFAKHWWVTGNATHLELSGSRITATDWKRYIPRGRNFGLRFNFARVSGNVLLNWKGRMLRDTSSLLPNAFEYIRSRYQLDGNIDYQLTKRFALYFAGRNLLNSQIEWEVVGPGAPQWSALANHQTFGAQYSFGVRGTF